MPRPKKQKDSVVPGPEDFDEAIEQQTQKVAMETLTGDVRDFILDRLRHEQDKRPWDKRSEAEQRDTVHRVETAVREIVTRAIEILAAGGRRTIKATLDQVTVKDGIVGKLVMMKSDPLRHRLFDSVGDSVLLVVADPEEFTGEREEVRITPDQGDLERSTVVHSQSDAAEASGDKPFH